MLNCIKRYGIISLAISFSLILITGCGGKIYSEDELHNLINNTVKTAEEEGSPSPCLKLPKDATYRNEDPSIGKNSAMPQTNCLTRYYKATNDTTTCALMNDGEAQSCNKYFGIK